MRSLYTLLITLALPFILLRLLWRSLRAPDYRRRIGERLGFFTPPERTGGIWIHAVSVGETQAIEPLIRRLIKQFPELPITLTTTTPTGSKRVRDLFADRVFHVYFPYDIPFILKRFFNAVQPSLLVMVETEIWPNLLNLTHQRGVYSLLANARLSERSARSYARFDHFTHEVFGNIDQIAVQNPEDGERFHRLGVDQEKISITGSIKFDVTMPASLHERAEVLKLGWGGRPVWVAASTHEGEEVQVIEAHRQILQTLPNTLLILFPRHPERFDRVAALCEKAGMQIIRRSLGKAATANTQLLLGDTMGELTLFLAAADAAFVGGSLVELGGHNLLEPAACGIPVAFGPHIFNFKAIAKLLLERDAAAKVDNAEQLAQSISHWLGDASMRSQIGENGKLVIEENRGALDRLYQLLEPIIRKGCF